MSALSGILNNTPSAAEETPPTPIVESTRLGVSDVSSTDDPFTQILAGRPGIVV